MGGGRALSGSVTSKLSPYSASRLCARQTPSSVTLNQSPRTTFNMGEADKQPVGYIPRVVCTPPDDQWQSASRLHEHLRRWSCFKMRGRDITRIGSKSTIVPTPHRQPDKSLHRLHTNIRQAVVFKAGGEAIRRLGYNKPLGFLPPANRDWHSSTRLQASVRQYPISAALQRSSRLHLPPR